MSATQPPETDRDLEYVRGMKVLGANIMVGVYADGRERIQIYTAEGATLTGTVWDVEDGLLPPAAAEVDL